MTEPQGTSAQALIRGIDVSHDQGSIDWAQVAHAGFAFAFVKATEGVTLADPQLANNWSGAQAAQMLRGAYHFYHPNDDPVQQARFFLETVQLAPGDLPPALDVEVTDGQTASQIVQGVRAWLSAVATATHRTPILYTRQSFWNGLAASGFGQYPLWVADFTDSPPRLPAGWTSWTFWQFSETGEVAGIDGNVDLNLFAGSLASLRQLA